MKTLILTVLLIVSINAVGRAPVVQPNDQQGHGSEYYRQQLKVNIDLINMKCKKLFYENK